MAVCSECGRTTWDPVRWKGRDYGSTCARAKGIPTAAVSTPRARRLILPRTTSGTLDGRSTLNPTDPDPEQASLFNDTEDIAQ